MNREPVIRKIEAGTTLFHFSARPEKLIESGSFNPLLAESYGGSTFLATEKTIWANCEVTAAEDLQLLDITKLPYDQRWKIREEGGERLPDSVDASQIDGCYSTEGDRYTVTRPYEPEDSPEDICCAEVMILMESVHKLREIRAIGRGDPD